MASSCGPYHQEALRRQRVVDKKRAAMERLTALKEEEERMALEKKKLEEEEKRRRHDEKMKELQEHLNAVKGKSRKTSRQKKNGIPPNIMKNIQVKDKILRNSNLLIGHPNALWEAR